MLILNKLYSQTNELKPMKKSELIKWSFAAPLMLAIFVIGGCKKETVVKPVATVTAVSETNFLKGVFDGEPVKYEGNAQSYSAFVDPDSTSVQNPDEHDHDAYYQSGTKWMTISSGTGLQITNASVELRTLSVRVFVSPVASVSDNFYSLLGPATYPVADVTHSSKGAVITMRDKNGVLWTSHGDQTGSTMLILSRGANMGTYTVVTGTLSCKMYDTEGSMKQLTGATFTAAMGI